MDLILSLTIGGVVLGCVYALAAVGFGLMFSTAQILHIAHGVAFVWSGYAGWVVVTRFGSGLLVGLGISVAVGIAIAAATEYVVYRPLRRRGGAGLILLLASLAVLIIGENVAAMIWGGYAQGVSRQAKTFAIGPTRVTDVDLSIVVVLVLFGGLTTLWIRRSRTGKAMRALPMNPTLARILGIEPELIYLRTHLLAGMAIGAAGYLVMLKSGVEPYGGFSIVLFAALAVLIGGVGSIAGSIAGGLAIGIGRNLLGVVPFVSSRWETFWLFVLLLALIWLKPRGFFGARVSKAEL